MLRTANAFVLKQADDGTPISEACRKTGFRTQCFTNGARSMRN